MSQPSRGDVRITCDGEPQSSVIEVYDGADWIQMQRVMAAVVTLEPGKLVLSMKVMRPGIRFSVPSDSVVLEMAEMQRDQGPAQSS
jgi:hypothetical protein